MEGASPDPKSAAIIPAASRESPLAADETVRSDTERFTLTVVEAVAEVSLTFPVYSPALRPAALQEMVSEPGVEPDGGETVIQFDPAVTVLVADQATPEAGEVLETEITCELHVPPAVKESDALEGDALIPVPTPTFSVTGIVTGVLVAEADAMVTKPA